MFKIAVIVFMTLAGVAGGAAARYFLQPHDGAAAGTGDASVAADCGPRGDVPAETAPPQRLDAKDLVDRAFVKLNNQFIVPVVTEKRVAAMVILSLSIEAESTLTQTIYDREPKLRTLFLQALFDQATAGRFNGAFATAANLDPLREELTVIARRVVGPGVSDVLITDINRQDI